MRIGELAKKTEVPTRMLRYYEEQGLITPRRLDNGYREYDDYLIDRVRKIRDLLDSGVPTRIIGDILPCLGADIIVTDPDPIPHARLVQQRDKMAERIAFLTQSHTSLEKYIAAMERASAPKQRAD